MALSPSQKMRSGRKQTHKMRSDVSPEGRSRLDPLKSGLDNKLINGLGGCQGPSSRGLCIKALTSNAVARGLKKPHGMALDLVYRAEY